MENIIAVNQDKFKAMLMIIYQKATRLETKELNATYDDCKLQNKDSENLLGVKIDKNLSCKTK